jgi:uncharacterized protein (DUF58 family)
MNKDQKLDYLDPLILSHIGNLEVIARRVVEGFVTGLHTSPYQGFNVEFAEHRVYNPGDEIKHIDWKVYARSENFFIKRFEAETNLRGYLMLDCSASMNYGDKLSKLEYGKYIAASLAYLMLKQRDSAGLMLFDEEIRAHIPPRSLPSHLRAITETLQAAKAERQTRLSRNLTALAERIKRRGLVVIISDLLDDPDEVLLGLKHLRHQHHELILFHVLHRDEIELPFSGRIRFVDLEQEREILTHPTRLAGEYKKRMKAFLDRYKEGCLAAGVDYVPLTTDQPLHEALFNYLSMRMGSIRHA